MIAQELEVTLHMAFVEAREKRHSSITVEHLLVALLDNPTAAAALRACGADLGALRRGLLQHIEQFTPVAAPGRDPDTQPNMGFQRVIQRAILNVQSASRTEVTGADVLAAIFGEKDCLAERLLRKQNITLPNVANDISNGHTNTPQADQEPAAHEPPPVAPESRSAPVGGRISRELEVTLHMAFVEARQKRHEFITVEHLLLALLENSAVAEILRACRANMDELRKVLDQHIAEHTPLVAAGREIDTQPTLGFQRVIQRAILHVSASPKSEVTGANVLVAIFGEKDSHAVYFLRQEGIARLKVVAYLSGAAAAAPSQAQDATSDVRVVLYSDEATPMEFVAQVLQEFFDMGKEEAAETLLEIYRHGKAVCGLYTREDGESLVRQVVAYARQSGHPLRCETLASE